MVEEQTAFYIFISSSSFANKKMFMHIWNRTISVTCEDVKIDCLETRLFYVFFFADIDHLVAIIMCTCPVHIIKLLISWESLYSIYCKIYELGSYMIYVVYIEKNTTQDKEDIRSHATKIRNYQRNVWRFFFRHDMCVFFFKYHWIIKAANGTDVFTAKSK